MITPYPAADFRGREMWILRVHDDEVRTEVFQDGHLPLKSGDNLNLVSALPEGLSEHTRVSVCSPRITIRTIAKHLLFSQRACHRKYTSTSVSDEPHCSSPLPLFDPFLSLMSDKPCYLYYASNYISNYK